MAAATPAPYPAPAPQPSYQPVASQPYQQTGSTYPSAPYQAAPPQKSGGALKIILIVVGVIVVLGILGVGITIFTVARMAHHIVQVDGSGKDEKVTLRTPGGTFTANADKSYTAAQLGIDIYPGATPGKGSLSMDLPTGSMITGVFLTSDPKDKVVDYYKAKFGSDGSTYDSSDSAVLTWKKTEQDVVMVTVSQKSSDNDGKTQIAIVHTHNKKS
jgi:hypothetical protein